MKTTFKYVVFLMGTIFLGNLSHGASADHQIGEVWGKEEITFESLSSNPFFSKEKNKSRRIAEATAWLTHPFHGASSMRMGPQPEDPDPKNPTMPLIPLFLIDKLKQPLDFSDLPDATPQNHVRYIGSAHLLGQFEGKYIMATNSHLIQERACGDATLEFVFLEGKPKAKCVEVIIIEPDLDLALIRVEPADETAALAMAGKGVNLDYDAYPSKGTKLYTVGASDRENDPNDLTRRTARKFYLTRDDDCRVLADDVKFLRNTKKETENFKPRHAYSFANGCDAFKAGDCGALYVEEETGKIIGMYWTEGEKAPTISVAQVLNDYNIYEPVWQDYTYGAPSYKIKELMLSSPLAQEPDYKSLFQAIFN